MYLEHFNMEEFPFSITPNTGYYCELPGHQAALNTLLVSLRAGEGFIKIIGEVGSGKTLLCRLLLDHLDKNFVSAYIPNPDLKPDDLRRAIAQELGIDFDPNIDQHRLLELINQHLLKLHAEHKHVVILLDEAQALPNKSIEALRLLTNLETESTKLLQVILFGQPELDEKLNRPELRQLKQRITFSYKLPPLKSKEIEAYICHRLVKAGYTYGNLFTPKAREILFKSSHGIPRLINILCHKAMMVAYGWGEKRVNHKAMNHAINDTEAAEQPLTFLQGSKFWIWINVTLGGVIIALIIRILLNHYRL